MAGLQDFRKQHPEYNDMSDSALADSLYAKFYSDMPRDKFNEKMGVSVSAKTGNEPSIWGNLGTAFSQGLTLGTEDEIRAAVEAAKGGSYSDTMKALSQQRAEFNRQHPWLASGATALGSAAPIVGSLFADVPTAGAATGATAARTAALLREIAAARGGTEALGKGMLMGGAAGAAGAEPGEREKGAAIGAMIPVGLTAVAPVIRAGGEVGRSLSNWVQELKNPELKAQRLMAETVGPNAAQLARTLQNYNPAETVANIPTTAAQASGNLDLAGLELASRTGAAPQWGQFERARNQALYDALKKSTSTGNDLFYLENQRNLNTSPARIEALAEAQQFPGSRMVAGERGTQAVPEYAAPVLDALSQVRSGESGRTSAVQSVVNHVYGEIMRPGQPISAAQLYGLRKELADKLEKPLAMSDELGASVKASAAMTKKIIQGIDNALDNASNGKFSKYLEDYQEASRPVDSARAEQNILQSFENAPLVGGAPEITAHKLARAIEQYGSNEYGPTLSSSAQQKLADLLAYQRQAEDVTRSLKKGGTMGGGSQTAMSMAATAAEKVGKDILGSTTGGVGTAILKNIEASKDSALKDEMRRLLQDPSAAAEGIRAALQRNAKPTAEQLAKIANTYPGVKSAIASMQVPFVGKRDQNQE